MCDILDIVRSKKISEVAWKLTKVDPEPKTPPKKRPISATVIVGALSQGRFGGTTSSCRVQYPQCHHDVGEGESDCADYVDRLAAKFFAERGDDKRNNGESYGIR